MRSWTTRWNDGCGPRPAASLAEFQLQQPRGVLAKDLDVGLWLERQGIDLFQDASRLDEGVIAAEECPILQPAADLTHQLRRVIARRPAGELDVDVGLVQRHRDQFQVPGPTEVGGDDRQVREAGSDDVQVNRPRGVELDPLATGLARADAAGAGVKEAWNHQLRGLLPELEMSLIARIKVLHRRMELGALCPQLRDGTLQLLDGVRLPGID